MKLFLNSVFALSAMGCIGILTAIAEEMTIAPSARTGLQVTVYKGDLALIRDSRQVELESGDIDLAFSDISAGLQPETALLKSTDSAFAVREQVFDLGVIDRQALLKASIGQEVTLVRIDLENREEFETKAQVISVAKGIVLKIGDRIVTDIPGRLIFESLPPNLHAQPTLLASIKTLKVGDAVADLNYLTNGLTWRADYVAELGEGGKTIDLSAWATITNTTGTDFPQATLKLFSGEINRSAPPREMIQTAEMISARFASMAEEVPQESLSGSYLYTINRPVNLVDEQSKQLALLSTGRIEVLEDRISHSEGFSVRGEMSGKRRITRAERVIVFKNTPEAGLGVPLPEGVVRIFGQDSTGSLQLLGEDNVSHTPVGQEVRLALGLDFDVTVERTQTEFLRASERITISAHRLDVSNAKSEPVTVRLVEKMQGDWQITEESDAHLPVPGGAEWRIEVPALGKVQVTYRVRVRF